MPMLITFKSMVLHFQLIQLGHLAAFNKHEWPSVNSFWIQWRCSFGWDLPVDYSCIIQRCCCYLTLLSNCLAYSSSWTSLWTCILAADISCIVSVWFFYLYGNSCIFLVISVGQYCTVLVHALIHSCLDYCNSLQSATRFVHLWSVSAAVHGTLYWLDLPQWITYKLCLLMNKFNKHTGWGHMSFHRLFLAYHTSFLLKIINFLYPDHRQLSWVLGCFACLPCHLEHLWLC